MISKYHRDNELDCLRMSYRSSYSSICVLQAVQYKYLIIVSLFLGYISLQSPFPVETPTVTYLLAIELSSIDSPHFAVETPTVACFK